MGFATSVMDPIADSPSAFEKSKSKPSEISSASPKARDVGKSLCVLMSLKIVVKVSFGCWFMWVKIKGQNEGINGSELERERGRPVSLQILHVRAELGTAAVTEQECGGLFPLNATS